MNKKIERVSIGEVNEKLLKKNVLVQGLIERIVQTGGPTVFGMVDGTGSLSLKGFVSPGERAYPDIEEGDFVEAVVAVDEFQGEIEGNILKIKKKSGEDAKRLMKEIESQQRERARVTRKDFMVEDVILGKLRDPILKAAEEIRLAVIQNRPIIVRHHNDTDGYCSGFALERAILPLIERQHASPKAAWEYFKRAPSRAPYYELEDSIKDAAMSLRDVAKFSNKMPLIVVADNGASPEDLMAIKQAKIHGADVIVIDHHDYGEEDVISNEVLANINPHLVGEKGSMISAGMLCAEIAYFINENVENVSQIPALAGYADKTDLENAELVEKYLEIAKCGGYSKTLLNDISLVIDFVSTKVRFMEAREYVGVLFGEPRDKQKELVGLMAPYIRELDRKGLEIGRVAAEIEELPQLDSQGHRTGQSVTFQVIDIENSFPGFGFYPKPGRCVVLLHDDLKETKELERLVSVGVMGTAMTFRATDGAGFSTHELIRVLREKLPNAFVEGGGHKNAGSINFIPRSKTQVFEVVREFVKTLC